ncbi:hypothetical protein Tco_0999285 [Tanacetum coccineum]
MSCITSDDKTPKVSAFEKYAIDVEPIPPRQINDRDVHHGYLNSLRDTLDTLREIVEEARNELPSDSNLDYACVYTKRSQELLANASASCPKVVNKRDKFIATTPVTKKKHVTFADPLETSGNNTPTHVKQQSVQPTNVPILPSTRVNTATIASGSKLKSNTKKDKTLPAKSVPKKKVEDHPRNNKSKLSKKNHVDSCTSVRSTVFDTNSNSLCNTCNECINSDSHGKCVDKSLKFSKPTLVRKIWRVEQVKQTWQPTGRLFTTVGHHWKPTGRIIPLRGQCPLTRPTALTSDVVLADPQAHHAPVDYNIVCSNQLDPNIDWGSNVSNSPFSPATPEPAWSIPSSSLPVPINNWASVIASSYVPPPENSLLSQTGDIGWFIDWFCKKQGITELATEHLEGPAYEVVKAFHPDLIHLQFQMEECHKLLTNQVVDGLLKHNVNRPLLLGGPPGQVTIQTEFFFNKDLEYLRFGNKGDRLALSITKIKAAHYPDAGLEQMVPDQMWIEEECMYDISATYGISHWWFKRQKFYIDRHSAENNRRAIVRTHMRILSVIRIEVFSIYGYDYMKKIILRRADNQEYTIAENDFKDLYPSDFEDLYLLNLQGHLNHLPPRDKKILSTAVNLWIRNLVIRKRVEDFQLGIESYQTQLNLTKPRWEATDAHAFQRKSISFSDGNLQQIDEAIGLSGKDSRLYKQQFGAKYRFWTMNDLIKCKAVHVCHSKRLLKLRRILSGTNSSILTVDYPDSGDSTIDVVEDIPVDVPNILPIHPTLHMDFDFISSHNDLGSNHDVSSPSGDRNKIYDPGICIEGESMRSLATRSPVIDTLLPFSSENEDKVFNLGVLASKEKSPPSSHRGFKASKLFHHKSQMMIYGGDIPILDVPFLHFYPP